MAQISSPESPTKLAIDDEYDIMQYYVVDGVRLPPFCRGKMQDVATFPVRKDDVWIVSYPRAGVWLQDLIYLLLEGGDLSKTDLSLETVEDAIPFLEAPSPGLETLKSLSSPRYIKSHLPYALLPDGVKNKECKVIYITRNPKDVMCSFYDFHRTVRMVHYKGTFHQFFYRFINNKLGYGSYFRHVLDWWERRKDDNLLFLKYEDIRENLESTIQQLANFLGRPLTPAALKDVCTHFEEEVVYNRKEDRVGYWKYYFTVHMNEKFDKMLPDKLPSSHGLNFHYTL